MSKKSLMILGAGVAGISAARRALEYSDQFDVVVYEKADQMGGLWYCTDDPEHVCVYEGLRTNGPKELQLMPDWDYPQQDQWYFNAKEVQEYLVSYAEHHGVDKVVKYRHEVMNVERTTSEAVDNKEWTVAVKDLESDEILTLSFDYVMICNGHYNEPNLPVIPGQDRFQGQQLHSVKYRKAETFRDKRVLVIGSGVSSMDISMLLTKTAASVFYSQRTFFELNFEMPENLTISSVVKEITATGAIFEDDSICEVDTIIYATGYKYSFPFLSPSCGIVVEEEYIQDLYKHCINIKYPTMALIGMPFAAIVTILFDLQSHFVMRHWSGDVKLPTVEEMLKDQEQELQKRLDLGWPKRYAHKIRDLSRDYHHSLADTAGLERTKEVFFKILDYFGTRPGEDYLGYRNECYEILDQESFRTFYR